MAYIGNPPTIGQWRKLDDISGSFNGSTTTFTTAVGGTNVTAGSANQLIVSLGGVIQQPNVDYSVTTNSIIFTTAPASGLDFFAVLAGDALNAGTPGDGTVTTAKLGADLTVDLASGTAAAPSLTFDSNTGLFSPGADEVAISTGGSQRATIDSSGRLLVGTSSTFDQSARLQVIADTGTSVAANFYSFGADNSQFVIGAARGTVGSPTTLNSTDTIGGVYFRGHDGTSFKTGAQIQAQIDGITPGSDLPSRLVFSTTADGASSPTERMRITSAGDIGTSAGLTLGSTTPTAGGFYSTTAILGTGAGTNAVKFSTTTGKITYDTSSRLNKEQIENCPYGIAEIKQLQPRRYYRIDDQRLEVGFVADEVVGILPEFVPFGPKSAITGNEQDTEEIPLGVNYEKLTAVLTAALQEAVTKIESLEARLTAAGI